MNRAGASLGMTVSGRGASHSITENPHHPHLFDLAMTTHADGGPLRVVTVDDEPLARDCIRLALAREQAQLAEHPVHARGALVPG